MCEKFDWMCLVIDLLSSRQLELMYQHFVFLYDELLVSGRDIVRESDM